MQTGLIGESGERTLVLHQKVMSNGQAHILKAGTSMEKRPVTGDKEGDACYTTAPPGCSPAPLLQKPSETLQHKMA